MRDFNCFGDWGGLGGRAHHKCCGTSLNTSFACIVVRWFGTALALEPYHFHGSPTVGAVGDHY
eukprot:1487311-Amphidinium_carterae.1